MITGGEVVFLRRVKTGDYEHKEAKVTLTFSVPDNLDHSAHADEAQAEAVSRCEAMLTGKAAKAAAPAPVPTPEKAAAPVVEKKPRAKSAKDEAAEAITGGKPAEVITAKAAPVEDTTDNAVMDDAAPAPAASAEDPMDGMFDDVLTAEVPPEVTDKDIVEAITKRNGVIRNPVAIKKLIGEYVGSFPARADAIPQAKRAAFLAELNLLPELKTGS